MSRSAEPVDWETHTIWFASSLLDAGRIILLVGKVDGIAESVGMVRFDLDDAEKSAEISINLNPSDRGKGLSKPLLTSALSYFRRFHDVPIVAEIRKTNIASVRCFEGVGFEQYASDDSFYRYRLV